LLIIFIGIIERSAIDGQKVYHSDLEKAMRVYIQEHQSEFLPEGIDPVVIDLTRAPPEAVGVNGVSPESPVEDEFKQRERERNLRGLQWAWDTFEGASQVAKQSTQGALELIRDAWDQSSSTTILWFVIVILVLSNLWTLMRMGASRDEASRRLENRKAEEREKWVQSIVTALWEELAAGKKEGHDVLAESVLQQQQQHRGSLTGYPTVTGAVAADDNLRTTPIGEAEATISVAIPAETSLLAPVVVLEPTTAGETKGWEEEVGQLRKTLDALEQRVKAMEGCYPNLDSLD